MFPRALLSVGDTSLWMVSMVCCSGKGMGTAIGAFLQVKAYNQFLGRRNPENLFFSQNGVPGLEMYVVVGLSGSKAGHPSQGHVRGGTNKGRMTARFHRDLGLLVPGVKQGCREG